MTNLVVSQFTSIASRIARLITVLDDQVTRQVFAGRRFGCAKVPRHFHAAHGWGAIVIRLLTSWQLSSDRTGEILGLILTTGLPAFCFGLTEDLTKRVSVRARLLATMASGVLGWLLPGASITRVGMPGLDTLLSMAPLAVLFTAFTLGGVASLVNIIELADLAAPEVQVARRAS